MLDHPQIEEIVTTAATFAEVQEYALQLGRKKRLSEEVLQLAVAALPVTIVPSSAYRAALRKARQLIGSRDPDDVELLALALHTDLPLWSNDRDFESSAITRYTTAELLARLGITGESLP